MGEKLGRWVWVMALGITAVFLAACGSDEEVVGTTNSALNPTQQAIADMLTYQAENPRATRTVDGWVWYVRTATAEALLLATATPALNPTQEAIAAVLTYQAENPRPTKTIWAGSNIMQTDTARRALTPSPVGTPTIAPSSTPTVPPTLIPRSTQINIPAGTAPQIDGRLTAGEWDDASQQTIQLAANIQIQALYKHDAANLYVAFEGLDQGEMALFPELLLDAGFDSNLTWNANDYWFHVSANICQGTDQTALWQKCGAADGWAASDFTMSLSVIEMQIPYELVGLEPGSGQPVGIGWDVMALTADDEEMRFFWPETAVLTQPATWAEGTAVGGW